MPPHTVISDHDGKIVREVSITPIPVDRPPFPLPGGVRGADLLHDSAGWSIRVG